MVYVRWHKYFEQHSHLTCVAAAIFVNYIAKALLYSHLKLNVAKCEHGINRSFFLNFSNTEKTTNSITRFNILTSVI